MYGSDVCRVWIAFDHNLDPLAQPSQLITNVSCSAQSLELQELLIAELLGIIGLGPSFPYVEESEVITATPDKVLSGLVGVKLFILRSVEQGGGFG